MKKWLRHHISKVQTPRRYHNTTYHLPLCTRDGYPVELVGQVGAPSVVALRAQIVPCNGLAPPQGTSNGWLAALIACNIGVHIPCTIDINVNTVTMIIGVSCLMAPRKGTINGWLMVLVTLNIRMNIPCTNKIECEYCNNCWCWC